MSTHKVRIAYVINDILLGGAQTVVLAIASHLDKSRFEPFVFYLNEFPQERPNLRSAFTEAGIRLEYIGKSGITSIPRAIPRLARIFRNHRPDIVHMHLIDATIAGVIAARFVGVRNLVIHEHQTHSFYSWKVCLAYWCLRPLARLTICFTSTVEKEIFGKASQLSTPPQALPQNSCSIYNGVDIERIEQARMSVDRDKKRNELATPAEASVIISVARLVSWKGQHILLKAFASIANHFPNTHVWLVGEGSLRHTLEAQSHELGIANRTHFSGARTDVYELILASDIGVLALLYGPNEIGESVGVAGLEMMGCGLPFIASDYPSARTFVSAGESGLLVQPENTAALAEALTELLGDKARAKQIGAAGAAFVRSHMDWWKIVPIYEKIYELLHTL